MKLFVTGAEFALDRQRDAMFGQDNFQDPSPFEDSLHNLDAPEHIPMPPRVFSWKGVRFSLENYAKREQAFLKESNNA